LDPVEELKLLENQDGRKGEVPQGSNGVASSLHLPLFPQNNLYAQMNRRSGQASNENISEMFDKVLNADPGSLAQSQILVGSQECNTYSSNSKSGTNPIMH